MLPNALPPIIVQAALLAGTAIIFEAGLSFLGLIDPNVVGRGQIIGSNRPCILDATCTVAPPGLAIVVTALAISLGSDGRNGALDTSVADSLIGGEKAGDRTRPPLGEVRALAMSLDTCEAIGDPGGDARS